MHLLLQFAKNCKGQKILVLSELIKQIIFVLLLTKLVKLYSFFKIFFADEDYISLDFFFFVFIIFATLTTEINDKLIRHCQAICACASFTVLSVSLASKFHDL